MATAADKRHDKESMGDKARDTASGVADKARETASGVADKARETASNVADKARQVAGNVRDTADQGVSNAGRGLESLADTVRSRGPHGGPMGQATSAVADTLDRTGMYLEEHGLSGIADDVTAMIRRNPIPAVLIGVGVGFLLARLTTPRS